MFLRLDENYPGKSMNRPSSVNTNHRWIILIALFGVQGIVSMAWFSLGPLAPFLIDAFHITRSQVGLFISMNSLALVLLSTPAGWLIDRFGIRWLLLLGPGAFGLLFALFSQVPSASIGYAVLFGAGIGYVFVPGTTTIGLVRWFPPKQRATAISIKQSGLTIGAAAGAVLIPSLSLLVGWRNAVAILGMVVVVVVALSSAVYQDRSANKSSIQAPSPRMFRRVLADRALLHLGLVGAAYVALQFSAVTYLILQLVEVRGMSEVVAGTFLMAANLGGAAGRILFGLLSDRVFGGQRGPVVALIGVISGATAILLSATINNVSWSLLYSAVIVFGFTGLGWNGVFLTFASELPSKESSATGLGWVMTLVNIGGVVGPPLFGYVVDVTSSYSPAWLLFGICALIAALSMMWSIKRNAPNDHN